MFKNSILDIWKNGKVAINGWLSIPNSFTAEGMSKMGWDSLTIDLQHGINDYPTSISMLQAIDKSTTTPFARVPWNEPGIIMKMLDAGTCGIIAPMINSKEEFLEFFGGKGSGSQISGGFALAHWCGDEEIAHEMQRRHGVTIRCVPLGEDGGDTEKPGKCIFTGRPSDHRVVWARAY